MGMAKKIKTILLERDITIKELAEKIRTNGNNLSNKLDRDYDGIFTLRDSGKMI